MTVNQEARNSVRCRLHSPDTGAETGSSFHQSSLGDCLLLFYFNCTGWWIWGWSELLTILEFVACLICTAPKRRPTPEWYCMQSTSLSKLQHHHCEKWWYRCTCDTHLLCTVSRRLLGTATISCMLVMGIDKGTSQCLIFQKNWEWLCFEWESSSMPRINWMWYNEQPVQKWKNNRFQQVGETHEWAAGSENIWLDGLPEAMECARQYALPLYGVKRRPRASQAPGLTNSVAFLHQQQTCQSHNYLPLRMLLNSMFNGLYTKLLYGATAMSPDPFCGIQLGRFGCWRKMHHCILSCLKRSLLQKHLETSLTSTLQW